MHGQNHIKYAIVLYHYYPNTTGMTHLKVEVAIERLKRHNSPGFYQIPLELIKAGGRTIRSEIHKLINSIWNREELPEEWKESIIVPIYKKGDKTDCGPGSVVGIATAYGLDGPGIESRWGEIFRTSPDRS